MLSNSQLPGLDFGLGEDVDMLRDSVRAFAAALAGVALLLAGCASDKPTPAKLEPVEPRLAVRQAWTGKLDGVRFPLGVAARNGRFVVAGNDGTVLALDAEARREAGRFAARRAAAAA